ncbi:hypothetical protein ACHQM5_022719 [Ranunculus cassubicifolius]
MGEPPPLKKPRAAHHPFTNNSFWAELNPEILSLIFTRLQADELARVIPFVCKAWNEVVNGPYCWNHIDIEQWCRRCNRPGCINFALKKLVNKSNGMCTRISVFKLSDAVFSHLATSVKHLKVLQMPMSEVTDSMLKKHIASLKLLTFLDISNCVKITCKGIETIGRHCTYLVHLRRNMPPPEWQKDIGALATKTDDGEALVIADTMPGLRHLELGYGRFTDVGLDAILTRCTKLTNLDVIGSYGVKLDGDIEDKCSELEVFRPPWDDDEFQNEEGSGSSGDSEDSDSD